MKKKIIGIIVDILLIAAVFAVTDILMLKVFHSENVWLELGTYIVFYAIAFGGKKGICVLWDRFKSTKKENN
ncbi:MAG: hypothetical protein E7626_00900 [Ruminococcaceae bacterium]|nr:hypothetical protein [Oscillospiraceae bacterium]